MYQTFSSILLILETWDKFFYIVRDQYWGILVSYFLMLKTLLQFLPHVLAKIARCRFACSRSSQKVKSIGAETNVQRMIYTTKSSLVTFE